MSMTQQRLREIYGSPGFRASRKVISAFDHHCRDIIANSPFVVLATTDGSNLDISPKGDPAGFIEVEDDHHLLLPDRPGNNRIDGLLNIVENPQVALLFLIPTVNETLRVHGVAEISEDPDLCQRFAMRGGAPKTVTRIRAEEIYTHCGKAPLRAGLWKPDTWPTERPVATLSAMIRDHAEVEVESTDQAGVDELYEKTLY